MFQDEARFGRINDPRRCWVPQGLRPEVSVQIVREYTYLLGAVSPQDGILDTLVLPEVTAETMSIFLAEVAERHPHPYILMASGSEPGGSSKHSAVTTAPLQSPIESHRTSLG